MFIFLLSMPCSFEFPIPFSDEDIERIQKHFDPDNYDPEKEGKVERNKNRIWAAPVRDILVPKYQTEVSILKALLQRTPRVALVLVGNDPASGSYVTNLEKILAKCGIDRRVFEIAEREGQAKLNRVLEEIAAPNSQYSGVICQLPLPNGFSEYEMRKGIDEERDIDGLNPNNLLKFIDGEAPLLPATVGGVAMAIHTYGIPLSDGDKDREIAVLGYGKLVGQPVSTFLGRVHNLSFRLVNEDAPGMPDKLRECDIIISGTGKVNVYDERIINPQRKQVLLDIDFGVTEDGMFLGGFTERAHQLAYMSMRNPGGSGLFTQLYAIHNILTLAGRQARKIDESFALYQEQ